MGRTILVTGGNRGIGLAIVKGLSKNKNDTVLLGCRDIKLGNYEANKIGSNVKVVEIDLSNRKKLIKNIHKIKENYNEIDVLINNAGIINYDGALNIDYRDFEETMNVNFNSAYELIKSFVSSMIRKKYGRIVNVSSGWGSFAQGLKGPFSYSVSKAALNALTLSISNELPNYIKINSMSPGKVMTRMGVADATLTPEEGADTVIWLVNIDDDGPTGKFFRKREETNW